MSSHRKQLPAFHENQLEDILQKFNLLEIMEKGELLCSICNITITKENFGCIFLDKDGEVRTSCSNPECLEKVSMEIE